MNEIWMEYARMGEIDGVPMTIADAAARSWTLKTSPIHDETMVMIAEPPMPAKSLMAINAGMFGASEHPNKKALKNAVDQFMTIARPYISESGARNSGPTAYPRT